MLAGVVAVLAVFLDVVVAMAVVPRTSRVGCMESPATVHGRGKSKWHGEMDRLRGNTNPVAWSDTPVAWEQHLCNMRFRDQYS